MFHEDFFPPFLIYCTSVTVSHTATAGTSDIVPSFACLQKIVKTKLKICFLRLHFSLFFINTIACWYCQIYWLVIRRFFWGTKLIISNTFLKVTYWLKSHTINIIHIYIYVYIQNMLKPKQKWCSQLTRLLPKVEVIHQKLSKCKVISSCSSFSSSSFFNPKRNF